MPQGEDESPTQIALHAVRNVLGGQTQKSLFADHVDQFGDEFGVAINTRIERFGIDLTDQQSRVMEGILQGFSKTAYRGNIESQSKTELASEKYGGKLPDTYRYVDRIPRLRATQSEILAWSGVNTGSIEAWSRAVKAIKVLGTKQYCFFYDRLVLDDEGNAVKDQKTGKFKKESVIAVDTLFTVKEVRDGSHKLKYYEITPSAIFLDQRESYFMLVPNNWREEVRALYGNRKASSYTFSFLLFLRYQYELKRRNKSENKPYTIRWSPEQIAESINMPEGTYSKRKKRANEVLDDAYSVAKKLGYLVDYERLGYLDVLVLNERKFHDPANRAVDMSKSKRGVVSEVTGERPENLQAIELFRVFHASRTRLDDCHEEPTGALMARELIIFTDLLKRRQFDQVKKVIEWSSTDPFWASRLATARRLQGAFSEAVAAMGLKQGSGKATASDRNRQLAERAQKELSSEVEGARIEVLSSSVEVGTGVHQPDVVKYTSAKFEEQFRDILQKWRFRANQTANV